MADIVYQCAQCDRKFTVSEYADTSTLKCPDCKSTDLAKAQPDSAGDQNSKRALRLRPRSAEPDASSDIKKPLPPNAPSQAEIMKNAFGPNRKASGKNYTGGIWNMLGAWALFLAIGGLTYVLRFQEIGVPAEVKSLLREYAWIPLAVMWLVTMLNAFKDSVLMGILCLLIPGFFLYYLMIQDHFYLRAVTFGLLVGFGYDTGLLLQEGWDVVYTRVSEWIASGGGD